MVRAVLKAKAKRRLLKVSVRLHRVPGRQAAAVATTWGMRRRQETRARRGLLPSSSCRTCCSHWQEVDAHATTVGCRVARPRLPLRRRPMRGAAGPRRRSTSSAS